MQTDPQSPTTATATAPQTAPAQTAGASNGSQTQTTTQETKPEPALNVPTADESTQLPACLEDSAQPPTVIDAKSLSGPVRQRKSRRNGHVACLPKLQRDMVNRMLWNGVPYKNIVAALDESGFSISERNISNWATGGYLDWRLEQDLVLQNRLDQDHLVDHLRRDDASELPEVGLQAAATRLSQILLQKLAKAEDLENNIEIYGKMVDLLCRLEREITQLQKQRDDSRRSLGRAHDPARIKDVEQCSAIEHERFYSNPPSDSKLSKPAVPPMLPPKPTSEFLVQCDEEEAHERKMEFWDNIIATARRRNANKTPAAPNGEKALPPAEAPGPTVAPR